ncbi:MAG: hypothetical protein GY943_35355, partial [Chloroflexi bacterium]|nr:hypothetical protein [Chloroflexota bacterium]
LTFTKLCNQHLLFHAAGVATRKSGILLCGASGSGKSTFTARLIADGYRYLSDELIALDKTGMQGWLRPIVLKSGSRFFWEKWLDKSAQQHMMLTSNGTAYIDPTLIKPDSICRFSRPTQLVFPHYSPQQPTQLTRLSKADAAYQLMHLLINATALPQHGLDQVTALCKQIPAYHLIFSDLETAVSKLDTLVIK